MRLHDTASWIYQSSTQNCHEQEIISQYLKVAKKQSSQENQQRPPPVRTGFNDRGLTVARLSDAVSNYTHQTTIAE